MKYIILLLLLQHNRRRLLDNATSSSQQSGVIKGGDGRVELENNTQGGGNDPLSQMGESIGNIFGQ